MQPGGYDHGPPTIGRSERRARLRAAVAGGGGGGGGGEKPKGVERRRGQRRPPPAPDTGMRSCRRLRRRQERTDPGTGVKPYATATCHPLLLPDGDAGRATCGGSCGGGGGAECRPAAAARGGVSPGASLLCAKLAWRLLSQGLPILASWRGAPIYAGFDGPAGAARQPPRQRGSAVFVACRRAVIRRLPPASGRPRMALPPGSARANHADGAGSPAPCLTRRAGLWSPHCPGCSRRRAAAR